MPLSGPANTSSGSNRRCQNRIMSTEQLLAGAVDDLFK